MSVEFISCPWCGQRNPNTALECRACGGALPVIGEDPGVPPPPPPRPLPKGYKRRMLFKNSPLNLIGGIFTLVGLGVTVLFSVIGWLVELWLFLIIGGFVGLVFTTLGGGLLYFGLKQAYGKLRPYEKGLAADGEIIEIYRDTTTTVNGRNPWAVRYAYQVQGLPYEGKTVTWNNAPGLVQEGKRVHVLYLPEDPQQSVLYPPLG